MEIADPETLTVNEIYQSIQGESTWAGLRCVFVRLTFCNLRCTYCDTEYAFYEGKKRSVDDVFDEVVAIDCPLIEMTGGEPLLQRGTLSLMARLCDAGRTVLIETSGNRDISVVDPRVHIIMDLKTPSSGEVLKNRLQNIEHLKKKDEVKFVIGSQEDYEWARDMVWKHGLIDKCGTVLFSPVFGKIDSRQIVEWQLRDKLDVRFQLQMHKFIWEPDKKSV
jgi:7-carboxy-7-deazaguanine synthase